jgi:hypothetical protein
VLAVQESVTEVVVMLEACKFVGTVGRIMSGKGRVVVFTKVDWAELFPA